MADYEKLLRFYAMCFADGNREDAEIIFAAMRKGGQKSIAELLGRDRR